MNIHEQLYELVAKGAKIPISEIHANTTLKDIGISSLDSIELMFDLEDHFGIALPDGDTRLKSGIIHELVALVEELLALKTAATA